MQREKQDGNPYNNGFEYGVRHFLSPKSGLVSEAVVSSLEISRENFLELLHLGSIYVAGKRILEDIEVEFETYIRVHTKPRRFPHEIQDWSARLVFQNEDFVVVNKPAAIPVHASVDNRVENLHQYLMTYLHQELFVTHRLDVPTRGLIVFAKTKRFQSEFNALLIDRAVEKIYHARAHGTQLVSQIYVHYMEPSPRAPKTVSETRVAGWQECRLRVMSAAESLAHPGFQDLKIELLTGRTHQIRAQLSALRAPIRGDVQYGAAACYPHEEIDLTAISLRFGKHYFTLDDV